MKHCVLQCVPRGPESGTEDHWELNTDWLIIRLLNWLKPYGLFTRSKSDLKWQSELCQSKSFSSILITRRSDNKAVLRSAELLQTFLVVDVCENTRVRASQHRHETDITYLVQSPSHFGLSPCAKAAGNSTVHSSWCSITADSLLTTPQSIRRIHWTSFLQEVTVKYIYIYTHIDNPFILITWLLLFLCA